MKSIYTLLIEYNEGDNVLTKEALCECKIMNSISEARDGREAIQYLEKQNNYIDAQTPDIILLDINLPKMNEYEVLKRITSNNITKHIPVSAINSSSFEKCIVYWYQYFVASFITKTLEIKDLLKVMLSQVYFGINLVQLEHNNIF